MLIDLSHPMRDGMLSFPGDPVLSVKPFHTTSSPAKCNVSQLSMGTHQGTHLDAMFHFLDDGKTLDQMPLDWFYGPARMIRIPKSAGDEITVEDFAAHEAVLQPGARILMNTGWYRELGSERFFTEFPSITQDAARYLASRKLRLIGMDTPTPGKDYVEVHHILLAKDVEMVIVESLANLDALPDGLEFTFIGFPLNFAGRDGSPIRAVAVV
jgi:kynurenine formamidase